MENDDYDAIINESDWIENFIIEILLMVKSHKRKEYRYIGDTSLALYSNIFPPEYKIKILNNEEIIADASDDIYCFLIKQFYKITGINPPINFQMSRLWKEIIIIKTDNWNKKRSEAFMNIFQKGTYLDKEKRFHNIDELLNDKDFLLLTNLKQ